MSPTLKEGSTIIVKPIDVIKMGDVVVIEGANNNLLVHRIAHKIKMGKKEWYIHIGDNSSYPGLVSGDEIVGKVDPVRNFIETERDNRTTSRANNGISNGVDIENAECGMRNKELLRIQHSTFRTPFVTLFAVFLHLGAFLIRLGLYPRSSTANFSKHLVSTAKFLLHRMLAFGRLVPKNVI